MRDLEKQAFEEMEAAAAPAKISSRGSRRMVWQLKAMTDSDAPAAGGMYTISRNHR